MPVSTPHPEYESAEGRWRRARDVIAGADAVRAAGTLYLPRPAGFDNDAWSIFLERATFYNAAGRTVAGLVGALFRKASILHNWPVPLEPQLANITLTARDLDQFAMELATELVSVGRVGILTEMLPSGARAYLRAYRAEDIINWFEELVDGEPVLRWVVLRECARRPKASDPFVLEEVIRYRVLRLDDAGLYEQLLFEEVQGPSGPTAYMQIDSVAPLNRGQRLDRIPFIFVGPNALTSEVARGPIDDLTEVLISHWRSSADVEWAAWNTACPMPYITGVSQAPGTEFTPLKVGSGACLVLPDAASKVAYLQVGSDGLAALENRLAKKEALLATLGARLLENQKAGVEAAQTVAMRHAGEHSILSGIAVTLSQALTVALRAYAEWSGEPGDEISYELTRDYAVASMSAPELTALMSAFQSGAIGTEVLYTNLKAGEMLPDEMDLDAFVEDRDQNGIGSSVMRSLEPAKAA